MEEPVFSGKARFSLNSFFFFSLGIICFLNYTTVSLLPSYNPLSTVCAYVSVCVPLYLGMYAVCIYVYEH